MKNNEQQIRSLIEDINTKAPTFTGSIRALAADSEKADAPKTFEISVSSETPYERWFGIEVLGHKAGEVDMGWLESGNAPLLLQHDHSAQIGVIDSARLEGGRVTASVRFGKSALAQEIQQDVEDGIRSNVSIGYRVNDMKLIKTGQNGEPDEYRVTKWRGHEASVVSIPADETVGTNRATDDAIVPLKTPLEKDNTMDLKAAAKALGLSEDASLESILEAKAASAEKIATGKADAELKRQADIRAIADLQRGKITEVDSRAKAAIEGKKSVESFQRDILDAYTKGETEIASASSDLSKQEKRDLAGYSFVKAIREQGNGKLTGIEAEMHQQSEMESRESGTSVEGVGIPHSILSRDLTVTTEGADVVATGIQGFITLLRNKMVVQQLGARVLTGLTGNFHIPKMTAGGAAAWEGENDANAEGTPTIGQVAFSPNRVGLFTDISKKLLLQSSVDIEAMVREDLATSIALAIDYAAINGAGANDVPEGILQTSGIGSVAGGTDGLAPTWAHIVALETAVANANADMGSLGYLTNSKVRGKLKTTAKVASTDSNMIWGGGATPLNEYACAVSNQVPSTLVKGGSGAACSAIIFGNWNDLVIAQWGGLDLVVDNYTQATSNLTRIVANTYADVGVRHPESFAAMQDALTV